MLTIIDVRSRMSTEPTGKTESGKTDPLDAPAAFVGRTLDGRYELQEVLHMGGMGIVYRGTQLKIGRPVAIKLLRPTLAQSSELVERFEQEVEVVGAFFHPNIVSMIDAGRDAAGTSYLVMEYIDGITLAEAIENQRLNLAQLVEVFCQICDALEAAHSKNIVHRDLKFENIMIKRRKNGKLQAKVLDFGVAQVFSEELKFAHGGRVPGTPGIIAPELLEENEPLPQSDLYSLGVLLFTALAGRPPFEADSDLVLMRKHRYESPPSLPEEASENVPNGLVELIDELLAKQPDQRPPNPTAVRMELRRVKEELPTEQGKGALSPVVAEANAMGYGVGSATTRIEQGNTSPEWVERLIRRVFGTQPLIAPKRVLAALVFLLLVLVTILIRLMFF